MLPLQQFDISQAEFEDFCEKWAFEFHERAMPGVGFNGDYDQMWKDFESIQPTDKFKYEHITKLGTKIKFKYCLDNYINPGSNFFTFEVEQIKKNDKINNF